jgi:hypothetical protein
MLGAAVTLKLVELVAVPPGVVTLIGPLVAALGTVAVIWVSEFTVNCAAVPLKATFVAPVNPEPLIVTEVPTGPLVGENELILSTAMPLPVRVAVCGLPLALSVTVKVAVRVPPAVGLNVTLMVQLELAASELPQLLDWAKSPLLVPVTAMLEMLSAAPPEFVSVTGWAALAVPTFWLLNVSEAGESAAVAAAPVPVRLAVCGLFVVLSETANVAVRVPRAVGVKVTLIVHVAPAARLEPQLFVWAKSVLLVPVMAMLLIVIEPEPAA